MNFSTIRLDAGNDTNGNPRRVFVTLAAGEIIAAYDEEYRGDAAILNPQHRAAYRGVTLAVSPREYNALVTLGGAHTMDDTFAGL